MSMWRSIPMLVGDVVDRPVAADVPYGTQWHDPNTGLTWASDEIEWHFISALHLADMLTKLITDLDDVDGAMSPELDDVLTWDGGQWTSTPPNRGGPGVLGPWIYDGLEPDLVFEPTWLLDGCRTAIPITCSEQGLRCIVAHVDPPRTDGTARFEVFVNGMTTGLRADIDNDNPLCAIDTGSWVLHPCDLVEVRVTTSTDWAPDSNVTVMVELAAPPRTGQGGGTLARMEVVFSAIGETTDGGTLARMETVLSFDEGTTDGGTLARMEVVDS
jgi:hypothetical protein